MVKHVKHGKREGNCGYVEEVNWQTANESEERGWMDKDLFDGNVMDVLLLQDVVSPRFCCFACRIYS